MEIAEADWQLLQEWLSKHGRNTELAARTLGISRRTVQRWIKRKRPSMQAGVLLEQIKNGPAVIGESWRGLVRPEWRNKLQGR